MIGDTFSNPIIIHDDTVLSPRPQRILTPRGNSAPRRGAPVMNTLHSLPDNPFFSPVTNYLAPVLYEQPTSLPANCIYVTATLRIEYATLAWIMTMIVCHY